jgi:hypothetical protein
MNRLLLVFLIATLTVLGACASPARLQQPGAASLEASPRALSALVQEEEVRPGKSEGAARTGEWLYKGPSNLLWWPWKIIGSGLRGIPDGVVAGFDEGRMPVIALIVSPINAVTGLLTGMAEGAAMGPGLITPETDMGRAFSKPLTVPTTIWWY